MIRALAAKGGVIQINFHMGFINQNFRNAWKSDPALQKKVEDRAKELCGENLACQMRESSNIVRELVGEGRLPRVDWIDIVEHIHHAVNLVGADHVGIGSDFDGADMPYGMEDASQLPKITEALLEKGYSENDIQKILGGNTLRLMQDVETIARRMEATT